MLKKKSRHSSFFSAGLSNPPSPVERLDSAKPSELQPSPRLKARTLQKTRPTSIFGSLRSYHSLGEEEETLTKTTSNPASIEELPSPTLDLRNTSLLHHGEVQTAGSMFRKRVQYLVLTEHHLIRFKSQAKASEAFPEIPASLGRSNSANHLRMGSGGSAPEVQISSDPQTSIPLHNIVAVYKLDDGRPYFSIELATYDEASNQTSTINMQLNDPRDSELWLSSIRAAVTRSKLASPVPFGQKAIEYVARYLESEADYVPSHFRMFTVAQRASRTGVRSSMDDLGKLISSVCYLVIGLHKVHLVPLPRNTKFGSSSSMQDMNGTSYGITTLASVNVQDCDDAFHISFRLPFSGSLTLYLASASVQDVALCLRQAADYLRPLWYEQPFAWQVPRSLEDGLLAVPGPDNEDHLCFDRTLIAYCVGYNLDPSNIRYTVNYDCEDAPEFCLLEPNNPRRLKYTAMELLAVLRALRYNESFHAISFKRAKLDALHNLQDRHGSEHFSWSTKMGQLFKLPRLDQTPLLVQELQCLALKSSRLRRLDFSNCLSRKLSDIREGDRGSGICEAIFPLCALQLTNIDWITLDGISLTDIDIEYLYAAAIHKDCHFRAVELGRCSLSEDTIEWAIQGMLSQEDTLECLDLSNNPAKLNPTALAQQLGKFSRIRKLNLSKFALSSGPEPILPLGVLLKWKLEFLDLSGTCLNTESIDNLAGYLVSDQSNTLRQLHMANCKMGGGDVATLLESMTSGRTNPRNLHLYISGNRLERDHHRLVKAISRSSTPTHLTMQALEYSDEKSFRNLLLALASNKTIKYLDISRVSIPFDASTEACEKLKLMFETNTTLKELNISGEQAHLEAVTLGRGLCEAIKGLEKNATLETLRVENQALGLPGASALASVLETNSTLREIYCENNEINLQAFTTLVNSVRDNRSLLYLPTMNKDRAWNRTKLDREVTNLLSPTGSQSSTSTRSSVRRALSNAVPGRSSSARSIEKPSQLSNVTEQDVQAAVSSVEQKWEAEIDRLSDYLTRNYNIASKTSFADGIDSSAPNRPVTVGSLTTALEAAMLDQTPRAELDRQLIIPEQDLGVLKGPKIMAHDTNNEQQVLVVGEGYDSDVDLTMA
jgi:Ran GTPase-activating protein (RanGAP) involved in mRNA processing and transport